MLDLSSLLSARQDVSAVRVLNEEAFCQGSYRDGSVLKFRGVIRDVQDPELVMVGGTATPAPTDGEAIRQELVERVPLTVTLFPHASDWVTHAYNNVSVVDKPVRNECENECHSAYKGTKRSSADVDNQVTDIIDQEHLKMIAKKFKVVEHHEKVEEALVVPQAFTIYVYEGQCKDLPLDEFKVNEAFEFVGILDLMVASTDNVNNGSESVLSAEQLEKLQISEFVDKMHKRRSGVVLHCCQVSALQSIHHVRPHQSPEFYQRINASNDSQIKFCLKEWKELGHHSEILVIRAQLVQYLAQTMHGDTLAAEYLLLVLLSHVYSRADPSTPLGNLSLNLSLDELSTDTQKTLFTNDIYEMLTLLMPMVARVDLSLKALNSTRFMPHKDYEREMLLSGALQATNGTTMLVNETVLSTGQLNEQGVKNMAALQSLVDKMLLPYDFCFYTMDFPQDVAIVIVSEGKSVLPAAVVLPVVATDKSCSHEQPSNELFECFRLFLSVLRSLMVSIGNEEAEMAEKHYVECRKSEQNVVIEDLHRWLRLVRLVALSRGEEQISKVTWDTMLALEAQRLLRLRSDKRSVRS